MPRNWKLPIAIVLAALALDARAAAPVWIPPGDIALRDTVERLVDERVIDIPVLSWPIATAELRTALEEGRRAGRVTPAHELAVGRVEAALATGRRAWWAAAGQASDLRTFADDPREDGELGLRAAWQAGERIAGEIAVRVMADPDDGQVLRPDGTYVAARAGNWLLSGGWQDRWWGGGHDGSLQLSSNARPVFALSLDRETSRPFETPWLSWLGPWSLGTFIGALEGRRVDSDHALLWGLRAAVRPLPGLELGLTRNAQFCGDKPPCSLRSFWNVVSGNDNAGENVAASDEPGNQLATLEGRWAGHLGSLPLSIYYQHTGETIDNKIPRPLRSLKLASLGTWGSTRGGRQWRAHVEFSTTTCADFDDRETADCAYENGVFTAGYRYRGRVLGHSTDSDTRQWALGLSVSDALANSWSATLRRASINRIGAVPDLNHTLAAGPQTWWIGETRLSRRMWGGVIDASLGLEHRRDELTDDASVEPVGYIRWTQAF